MQPPNRRPRRLCLRQLSTSLTSLSMRLGSLPQMRNIHPKWDFYPRAACTVRTTDALQFPMHLQRGMCAYRLPLEISETEEGEIPNSSERVRRLTPAAQSLLSSRTCSAVRALAAFANPRSRRCGSGMSKALSLAVPTAMFSALLSVRTPLRCLTFTPGDKLASPNLV